MLLVRSMLQLDRELVEPQVDLAEAVLCPRDLAADEHLRGRDLERRRVASGGGERRWRYPGVGEDARAQVHADALTLSTTIALGTRTAEPAGSGTVAAKTADRSAAVQE